MISGSNLRNGLNSGSPNLRRDIRLDREGLTTQDDFPNEPCTSFRRPILCILRTILRQSWDLTGLLTFLTLALIGIGWHPLWQHLPTIGIGSALILIIGWCGTAVAMWWITPFDLLSRSSRSTLVERLWKFFLYLPVSAGAFILSAELTLQDSVSQALNIYIRLYILVVFCVSLARLADWTFVMYDEVSR